MVMGENGFDASWLNPKWQALSNALLDALQGRLNVIQTLEERQRLVAEGLQEVLPRDKNQQFPDLSDPSVRQAFIRAFLSYDRIEIFLNDPAVEDIMINATGPIFVHKAGLGLVRTDERFETSGELDLFVKKLLVFGGRSRLEPLNDLELADIRGRVNITQSPFGPQVTVTRSRPSPFTILQLIEQQELSYDLAAQLWVYVEGMRVRPANIIIAGGPGAGKTTLLNAILSFIPARDRLVAIEDTLELNTNFLENCSRLESTSRANMAALVVNSLRMRPDRIIVGEVRGAEARDLMTAMNLGKYCMGTLHASIAKETVLRLQNEPMNVPSALINLVDVIICIKKVNKAGKICRVIGELAETAGLEKGIVLLSMVWSYDQASQDVVEGTPSSVFRDKIATESGMTSAQVMEETSRRSWVLRMMHASGQYKDMQSATRFFQLYSDDSEKALQELKQYDRRSKR